MAWYCLTCFKLTKAYQMADNAGNGLRNFLPVMSHLVEFIFGTFFLSRFVLFESQSRVFIGSTLLFFFGLTCIRIKRKFLNPSSLTARSGRNVKFRQMEGSYRPKGKGSSSLQRISL